MNILAVCPPAYDFACYDLWLKPLGFLHILSFLKSKGHNIIYFDFLDRFHPLLKKSGIQLKSNEYGCGKFYFEIVEKPPVYSHIKRRYKRYGIPLQLFEEFLNDKNLKIDLILITSSLSYWYLGIKEIVQFLRKRFKNVKIILGGNYAILCREHAQKTLEVDFISSDYAGLDFFNYLKMKVTEKDIFEQTPLYQVYENLEYVALRTSWGCPFNCKFCGVKLMYKKFYQKSYKKVFSEIEYFYKKGVRNIAFYDDALLFKNENLKSLLELILVKNLNLKIHTPNGLHARFLDKDLAFLMKKAGFVMPRISYESSDAKIINKFSNKVTKEEFIKCIENLQKAGFKKGEYGVYLCFGFPSQDFERLKSDIVFCHNLGCKIFLADFSPVPKTDYSFKLNTENEPLLQNNSIFPAVKKEDLNVIYEIKNMVKELNKKF